ncbi:MAG: HAD hydrolase family protein [Jatrophihabitantaceae bacterium]
MAGFVQAVAVDLDGTIAHGAELDRDALAALDDCRAAGTATLLVTGRIESELRRDFPDLMGHFQAVALENGTVLGIADHRTVLAAVDPCLAQNLRTRGVSLREGSGILACHASDAAAVLDAIAERGLDAQVVHNRSELMVLPAGASKATGMLAALAELRISAHNTVAIGDAENDLSMLTAAQIGVAAAGSVDSVRRIADVDLTDQPGQSLADFLRGPVISGTQPVRSGRRDLRIGRTADGTVVSVPGAQAGILIAGESGAGKSHLTGLLAEQWIGAGYIVLVVDPEGEHSALAALPQTIVVDAAHAPSADELLQMLRDQSLSVVLDLSGVDPELVLPYLEQISAGVESLRGSRGLPHWIVIDEAHGVLGENGTLAHIFRPNNGGYCYVTYRPELLCTAAKTTVDVTLTALGAGPDAQTGVPPSAMMRAAGRPDLLFTPDPKSTTHVRHRNKYRQIALPERLRFQFRDPSGRAVAEAASVTDLVAGLDSVPDESIVYHALRGDFSRWAVGALQDRVLGSLLAAAENDCAARVTGSVKAFRGQAVLDLYERFGAQDTPLPGSRSSMATAEYRPTTTKADRNESADA